MRSRPLYPRSFRRLLAVGFALVVLPLAVGLVGDAISIRKLANKSREAVYAALRTTQASRALLENIDAQERVVRQYAVLRDQRLFDAYQSLHAGFGELLVRFDELSVTAEQRQQLAVIAAGEDRLHRMLAATPGAAGRGAALQESIAAQYLALAGAAQELLKHNNKVIDDEVESLQGLAEGAERTMAVQLLALLPAAALLVFGFTRVLAGPVAQLQAGIGGLAAGRFDRRIEVDGPIDLQSLGTQLDRLRLRLMQLEERKSRFLRRVSHELKTPLTALREGSDLLADGTAGPLTGQQKEIVAILTDNSLRLRKLIEDLLAYNAADFEQSVLRRQVFPLRELVDAVVESQRLAFTARALNVEVDGGQFALDADRERIRTVLDNLLSNAIKYSPPAGTIRIRARCEDSDAVIEVADEGPGIAEEDRDRVFDPFYQGRIPGAGPVKSSGLGLSIAQEHVLAHGGRLLLLPGPGARFQVRLPLQWH
ncbi:MAG TPA: HAMP domain-containing sensor histidine kinase [Rhodocyclaceae bacterium]